VACFSSSCSNSSSSSSGGGQQLTSDVDTDDSENNQQTVWRHNDASGSVPQLVAEQWMDEWSVGKIYISVYSLMQRQAGFSRHGSSLPSCCENTAWPVTRHPGNRLTEPKQREWVNCAFKFPYLSIFILWLSATFQHKRPRFSHVSTRFGGERNAPQNKKKLISCRRTVLVKLS